MKNVLTRCYTVLAFIWISNANAEVLTSVDQIDRIDKVKSVSDTVAINPVFSPNGRYLAFLDGGISSQPLRILDTDSWDMINTEEHSANRLNWLNNDIVVAGGSAASARIFVSIERRGKIESINEKEVLEASMSQAIDYLYSDKSQTLFVLSGQEKILCVPEIRYFSNPHNSLSGDLIAFSGIVSEEFQNQHSLRARHGVIIYDRRSRLVKIAGEVPDDYAGLPKEATTEGNPNLSSEMYPATLSSFSPSGNFLLFDSTYCLWDSDESNVYQWSALWVSDLNSGDKRQITPYEPGTINCLAWSSTGLICFTRNSSELGFYRLKLKPPGGTPSGE